MPFLLYCKEYYCSHGYNFNDVDIIYENPRLFKDLIKNLYYSADENRRAINDRYSDSLIEEYEYITDIQRSLLNELKPKSKLDLDEELARYKAHYIWGDIKSNDLINVVYWNQDYTYFLELIKGKNLKFMTELFDFDFKTLYGHKGFNDIVIKKIINVFKSWCNKQIIIDNEKDNLPHDDLINNVIDEFFR